MSHSFSHIAIKRRQLLVALAFVGAATTFLFIQNAYAYNLLGGRWPNQPRSGCCATFYIYYYPLFYEDSIGWDDGRHAWNNSPANVLEYSTSSCCTITVDDVNDNTVTWDGITYLHPCNSCNYTSANLYLNFYYTQHYSRGEIQSVAAHELGHMIGLAHSSGCVLMNAFTYTRWTVCGINAPVTDDVNGANSLY